MGFLASNPQALNMLTSVAGNTGAAMLSQPSGWAPTPGQGGDWLGALATGLASSQGQIGDYRASRAVERGMPSAALGGGPPDLTQPAVGAGLDRLRDPGGMQALSRLFSGGGALAGAPGQAGGAGGLPALPAGAMGLFGPTGSGMPGMGQPNILDFLRRLGPRSF